MKKRLIQSLCILFLFIGYSTFALAANHFEIEYSHSDLNQDFKDWNDFNFRTYYEKWVFEADYKTHFDESAVVLGATRTFDYTPLWYQDFSLSLGTNSKIVSALVLFSEIHRKFLESQALVLGLGLGYAQSENPYSDLYGIAEATYYFPEFLSIQAGVRQNQSSPGSVATQRYFASVSFLRPSNVEAVLKIDHGKEGYTVLGDVQFKNEFSSTTEFAQVRYWFSSVRGISLAGEFYQSTYYNRETFTLGYIQNF